MRVRIYLHLYNMWWSRSPSNPEADAICRSMNHVWSRMTPEEQDLARSMETR